jgi:hypothetical protein
VNALVQAALKHFTAFQDTMRGEGKLPGTANNDDSTQPALLAHFHLGRVASKLQVTNLIWSLM